jgi:hypothetical protein
MDYLDEDGNRCSTGWTSDSKDTLIKLKDDIIKQIKAQANDWVDRALENAIINGGTKDDGSTS